MATFSHILLSAYGVVLQAAGRLDEARRAYQRAIARSPADAEARELLRAALTPDGVEQDSDLFVLLLAETDVLVGKFTSNIGRIAYALQAVTRHVALLINDCK